MFLVIRTSAVEISWVCALYSTVVRYRSLISDLDGGCSSSFGLFLGCFEIGRVYFPFRCYLPLGYAHCNLIRCILSDMGEDKAIMDLVLESKNACGRTQVVVKLPMMMVLCIVGLSFAKLRCSRLGFVLLKGWSYFSQFSIAVVNKHMKKSKYSGTLHQFLQKERDWGWKKFMKLYKVLDGFIDADTFIIKAQVQVISGLKAVEGQAKSKNGRGKSEYAEDSPVLIVRIEEDMFILVDD
ncbi:hypothetical protein RHSIM_Rhsim04G0152800 [Rhododendron simsii]|uniref:MATH domain-containing protein n=1 Tax=Rhododendron simsii TaxID=118357 RepID=A0A834LMJ5_RHOSS|nr:hypothetical protein RHSIM_Rhsim04G0152800 [Rhododendron simsii]